MTYAVDINGLVKEYKIYNSAKDRLKELLQIGSNHFEISRVINNIDLKIPQGKTIGIIGQNGSGKSTLLQIICGVLKPTEGNISVKGKISALLELGAGFNPEFTGIENVYMNGAIQGFTKEEMDKRFPLVAEFSEIGDYIYQPVKTYSSGMYVRLAFAAAINVDPDILIVDEALAVGDLYFQLKCIEKIKEFKENGKTIIYVTHDTYSVKNICDYTFWIHDGEIKMQGDPLFVVNHYEDFMKKKGDLNVSKINENIVDVNEDSREILSIQEAKVCQFSNNNPKQTYEINESFSIKVNYTLYKEIKHIVAGVAIFNANGITVCALNTKLDGVIIEPKVGQNELTINYKNPNLLPGTYHIDVGFFEESAIGRLDYKSRITSFNVVDSKYLAEGLILLDHSWDV